jgi:hypothetical protein
VNSSQRPAAAPGRLPRSRARILPVALASAACCASALLPAQARVTRFVVEQTRVFAEGREFGDVGQYQRLDGTAYFEVDPADPRNTVVVNLDKAPRNAAGNVEFSAPFFILKPTNMKKGNHKIFYGINNRGNKQTLGYFNNVPPGPGINDPITSADAGNGWMMRQGYAVVDAGWQGDVEPGGARMVPDFPVATQADGSPIVAPVRIQYSDRTIPVTGTFTLTLEGSLPTNILFDSYETSDTDTSHSTLTVQAEINAPKVPIAPDQWAFGSCPGGQGSLVPSTKDICLFGGFDATKLYELIYPAKSPRVMGLGGIVTRDIGSFLRYQTQDDAGNPNPLRLSAHDVGITHSYSFGSSSTGMYQREWLYLGYNEDESSRKVFDAIWIHKSGSHRLFANVQFADPNTYSRQDDRRDYLSTTVSPLTYVVTKDPVSGITDGLMKRPAVDPVVFDTDTGNEFWEMKASLKVQDGTGHPQPLPPDNVRMYFLSSFQHSGNNPAVVPAPAGICANLTNPNYHGPTVRALLVALDKWVAKGIAPPKSAYPRLEDGTLVSLADYQAAFPTIPGVSKPTVLNGLHVLDYGPDFGPTGGILSILPPRHGATYDLMVPKPDADGIDMAGIRPMETAAPLGTNMPWNVRAVGFRSPNLCGLSGSFVPFATTRQERKAQGDPRPSLQERYGSHAGYVAAVAAAAANLVKRGFLLPEDARRFVLEAERSDVLKK